MQDERSDSIENTGENGLVDPIYRRFVAGVLQSIGSTDFYAYFMESIAGARNRFQFSNRKVEKTVDVTWVDAISDTLEAFQNIIAAPRNVIQEEELIVNVANAKRASSETVRHLAQHAALVEDFTEETGDVRPSRLMQRYREDAISIYENRLVFTTLEYAYQFVKVRHDALFDAMSEEYGAKLKVESDMDSAAEHVHLDMFLHIKQTDSALDTDEKNSVIFSRISRLHRVLGVYMRSDFAQELAKCPRVRGNATKTNILKRNKNYNQVLRLWDFLRLYTDVGYTIKITEQNPEINERFERDIYHNILFNYLVLKGYLQDDSDRLLPKAPKGRQRKLKPQMIREIIEELTEDYDLPDVEIRRVLVEKVSKAQLMREEAEERRRLVEEQARLKREEEERVKAEKEAERQKLIAAMEAEKERVRLEKEAERQRLRQERMERTLEDRRRGSLFAKELEEFARSLPMALEDRAEKKARIAAAREDFADAAELMEEAERIREEAVHRELLRRREEAERVAHEKQMAEEMERLRQEKRLREQLEAEERAIAEAREKDRRAVEPLALELSLFSETLVSQLRLREQKAAEERAAQEKRERLLLERKRRRAAAK